MSTLTQAFVNELNAADPDAFYSFEGSVPGGVSISAFDLLEREQITVTVSYDDILSDPVYAIRSVMNEVHEKLMEKPVDSFERLG